MNVHAPGKVGDTVHYVPPIELAAGGAECRDVVITALGNPPHDDIYADLASPDGGVLASRVSLRIGYGYWDGDDFRAHLGNTWHPVTRCGVHPEPSVRVEWTDEGGGKLTIGGHLLPYTEAAIHHDPSGLPQLTVSLPLVGLGATTGEPS